jgi:lipid-A-disaccharide synthase
MVIGYKLAPVTGFIVRRMIRTPFVTLFNIAANAPVAPEFVQDACRGDWLAQEVARRLDDPDLRARRTLAQYAALDLMGRGGPDPNEAAAEAVLKIVSGRAEPRAPP